MEKYYSLEEAARLLCVAPHSLADRRYRAHHRLAARKLGRRLLFAESELIRIIEEGKEQFPRRAETTHA